jgi:hypothetical protein
MFNNFIDCFYQYYVHPSHTPINLFTPQPWRIRSQNLPCRHLLQ